MLVSREYYLQAPSNHPPTHIRALIHMLEMYSGQSC
jgi:hypothetical protein